MIHRTFSRTYFYGLNSPNCPLPHKIGDHLLLGLINVKVIRHVCIVFKIVSYVFFFVYHILQKLSQVIHTTHPNYIIRGLEGPGAAAFLMTYC